jgi:CelD/BcsL family acetyltransferase involved in cellulose biosynthesis
MEQFLAVIAANGLHVRYTENCVTRVTMNLPATWDTYINMISHNEKRMLKRRMRALMKHGVEVEVLQSSQNGMSDFDEFVRLHTATWADKGIAGYFASPRFTMFQRDIMSQLREKNMARLYFLKKDGVRFAAVQAFFVNDVCCFYLSGLDRSHELTHYSPGKVLLSLVINDAIKEGYKVFDFQGGKEEYKFRLGGKTTTFSKALVWKTGTASPKVYVFLISQTLRRFVLDTLWKDTVVTSTRKILHRIHLLQQKFLPKESVWILAFTCYITI